MDLASLQTLCDDLLQASILAGTDDQNGVYLPSDRLVSRLGLALEPFDTLENWIAEERLDALFLHRPWRLTEAQRHFLLTNEIGIVAYHLAFDERLTTGFNPVLAETCGWGPPEQFGEKEGRPLGMACALPHALAFEQFAGQMEREFGGPLDLRYPRDPSDISRVFLVKKIAVVGAMTDALVRAAHSSGAGAYVTGQFRQPARRAVDETGLGVIVLGHYRSEIWGLRTLAYLLRAHSENLEVFLPQNP